MKKFLFLICIILIKISYSQNKSEIDGIGFFFDINQQPINGYFNQNLTSSNALIKSFQIGEKYTPGYYYNDEGNKIEGLIKLALDNNAIKYRKDKDADILNISPEKCFGYVIGLDSFTVIQNFDVQRNLGTFHNKRKEFAKVIEQVNGITFFRHIEYGMQSYVITYLYKYDNSDVIISFPKGDDKFKETALNVFGHNEVLASEIKNGNYTNSDIHNLIKVYKYLNAFEQQKKIWFNSSWLETGKKENCFYYAIVSSYENSVFHIKYFTKDNTLVYEGKYTSLYPMQKEGKFIWYYPNGIIRKTIDFKENKPITYSEYYCSGTIHYEYVKKIGIINYFSIYDLNGKNILDNKGNGKELFYDSIQNREITYEYEKNKLATAYFYNSNRKKIFQLCKKNTILKFESKTIGKFKKMTYYPYSSISNFEQGYILLKCIIEPSGYCTDVEIIKSFDENCNKAIDEFITYLKSEKIWLIGKHDGEKITQEIVIPIHFVLKDDIIDNKTSNNYYMPNNMMYQNKIQPPRPKGF